MKNIILFTACLALLLFIQACSDNKLETLHGAWHCDGKATLQHLPGTERMDPADRELSARLLGKMYIGIDAATRTIDLNIGNIYEKRPFELLSASDGAVILAAGQDMTIEFINRDTIRFYHADDSSKKMVLRRK